MALRFRKSVQLFPGVRLNFSAGGISTTIGVRGASINVGPRGTHLNLGVPGTGLSLRTRLSPNPPAPGGSPSPSPPYQPPPSPVLPVLAPAPPPAGEIRSADVWRMTSTGLGDLKRLIQEAASRKTTLIRDVAERERVLASADRRVTIWDRFPFRALLNNRIDVWKQQAAAARDELTKARATLAACKVDVDFAFDPPTMDAFTALLRAYDNLRHSRRIWDMTASIATNRHAERTFATSTVLRQPVTFDYSRDEVIGSQLLAPRLANANGADVHIYPGFVMIRGRSGDFALVDVRELDVEFRASNFIEEESAPPDAPVVGQTWKKANKDGSPDRRFKGNFSIPILAYAQLWLHSGTGLREAFLLSNRASTEAFANAFANYKKALADLAERSKHIQVAGPPPQGWEEVEGDDVEDDDAVAPTDHPVPAPTAVTPGTNPWPAAIAASVVIMAAATAYLTYRSNEDTTGKPAVAAAPAASVPVPVAPLDTSPPVAARPPAPARESLYVQASAVNVRSGPSGSAQVLRTEKRGKRLDVHGRQGDWIQVGDDEPDGWVHASLLGPNPP